MSSGETQFYFKSTLFEPEPGEDRETNPLRFGKQLAEWLRDRLIENRWNVEPIIAEDWGWCLMCSRKPFALWVGCGNVQLDPHRQAAPPVRDDIVWTCFVAAESSWLSRWRNGVSRQQTTDAVAALSAQLHRILDSDPANRWVDAP